MFTTCKWAFVLSTVVLFFSSVTSVSAFQMFTDRSGWEAAVSGLDTTTETFDNAISGGLNISFDTGIMSTATGLGGLAGLSNNSVAGGVYHGGVDQDQSHGFAQILWTFPLPVMAFGADWISAAQGAGVVEITGNFDGSPGTVNLGAQLGNHGTGFLGIVGTSSFTNITLVSSHAHNSEIFEVDNFALARSVSAVPEPGTWLLFGTSLALGLVYRRLRF